MLPPQGMNPADVLQLAERSVRFGCIEYQLPLIANSRAHGLSQLPDGDLLPGSQVHETRFRITQQFRNYLFVSEPDQMQAATGHVIHIKELAARGAAPPHHHLGRPLHLSLVKTAHQRRQDVAVLLSVQFTSYRFLQTLPLPATPLRFGLSSP